MSGHTAALHLRRQLPKQHEVVVVTPNANWNWIIRVGLTTRDLAGARHEGGSVGQRKRRKNPRTCLTSDCSCSSAANWPPRGSSSNQRRSVNRSSASRRYGRVMSRGWTDSPDGAVTLSRKFAKLSQYRRADDVADAVNQ